MTHHPWNKEVLQMWRGSSAITRFFKCKEVLQVWRGSSGVYGSLWNQRVFWRTLMFLSVSVIMWFWWSPTWSLGAVRAFAAVITSIVILLLCPERSSWETATKDWSRPVFVDNLSEDCDQLWVTVLFEIPPSLLRSFKQKHDICQNHQHGGTITSFWLPTVTETPSKIQAEFQYKSSFTDSHKTAWKWKIQDSRPRSVFYRLILKIL